MAEKYPVFKSIYPHFLTITRQKDIFASLFCRGGEIGRHAGLKIRLGLNLVWVRVPPSVLEHQSSPLEAGAVEKKKPAKSQFELVFAFLLPPFRRKGALM